MATGLVSGLSGRQLPKSYRAKVRPQAPGKFSFTCQHPWSHHPNA